MELTLKLDAERVQALVRMAFPGKHTGEHPIAVEALRPGYARIRMAYRDWMLRPGRVISGPTLMTASDTAMYVAVLGHVGAEMMAVTADMNLRFLNKAVPGDVVAEASILKLGRRLVVMESKVWSAAAPEVLAMAATGSYAVPVAKSQLGI